MEHQWLVHSVLLPPSKESSKRRLSARLVQLTTLALCQQKSGDTKSSAMQCSLFELVKKYRSMTLDVASGECEVDTKQH